MKFNKRLPIIINLLILLLSCNRSIHDKVFQQVHQLDNYQFDPTTPLEERVIEEPDVVLNYLQVYDGRPDYRNYILNDSEKRIFKENLKLIPQSYIKTLEERLIGIYFIEDFWGSGLADYVVDSDNNIYSFIVLNPSRLYTTLNEAYLYKELTCFVKDQNDISLKVDISEDYNGILYTLIHELSHVIDYVDMVTPYTSPTFLNVVEANKNSTFVKDIWETYSKISDQYRVELFNRVSFYGFNDGPLMNISEAADLYRYLDKTPFITPYATLSWAEDMAELYTMQYLVTELGCNFEIEVQDSSGLLYLYSPLKRELLLERFQDNLYF